MKLKKYDQAWFDNKAMQIKKRGDSREKKQQRMSALIDLAIKKGILKVEEVHDNISESSTDI